MATVPPPVAMTTIQQPVIPLGLDMKHRSTVRGMAIAEVVLGSLCILFGAILIGMLSNGALGEGIWCGLWIIVAGGLGISAGSANTTRCLVNCHMAFSIVASVFTGAMFIIAINRAIILNRFNASFGVIYSFLTIVSFVAFILLIVSASYCCCTSNGCCQSNAPPGGQSQVVYVTTTQQPSAQMAPSNTQQGYQQMTQTKEQEFQAGAAQPPAYQL